MKILRSITTIGGIAIVIWMVIQSWPTILAIPITHFGWALAAFSCALVVMGLSPAAMTILLQRELGRRDGRLYFQILLASLMNLSVPFSGTASKLASLKKKEGLGLEATVPMLALATIVRGAVALSVVAASLFGLTGFGLSVASISLIWLVTKSTTKVKVQFSNLDGLSIVALEVLLLAFATAQLVFLSWTLQTALPIQVLATAAAAGILVSIIPVSPGSLGLKDSALALTIAASLLPLSVATSIAILDRGLSLLALLVLVSGVSLFQKLKKLEI